MIAHVRNAHPTKRMAIPLGGGWGRLLCPGVTTAVPERVLHTPIARQLLTAKLIELADGAAWDADARQRRAARTDMARAIAAAEQAEFDRMLRGVRIGARKRAPPRPRRYRTWTPEREALLRDRRASGVGVTEIAAELGLSAAAVKVRAGLLGVTCAASPRTWTAERLALLRRRWAEGAHRRKICHELGITRGQLCGKVTRLGLKPRDSAITEPTLAA